MKLTKDIEQRLIAAKVRELQEKAKGDARAAVEVLDNGPLLARARKMRIAIATACLALLRDLNRLREVEKEIDGSVEAYQGGFHGLVKITVHGGAEDCDTRTLIQHIKDHVSLPLRFEVEPSNVLGYNNEVRRDYMSEQLWSALQLRLLELLIKCNADKDTTALIEAFSKLTAADLLSEKKSLL